MFTDQVGGRLVVSAVLEGSPAQGAGVLAGDQVLAINGVRPGSSCDNLAWDQGKGSTLARVTLRRGYREWQVDVPLVPVQQILESWWKPTSQGDGLVVFASLRSQRNGRARHYGSYMLGLDWTRQGSYLVVTGVLSGSPAEMAGISVGDKVSRVDGVPVALGRPG